MRKWLLTVCLISPLLLSLACPLTAGISGDDLGCAEAVSGLFAMTRSLEVPEQLLVEDPVKQGDEFDANRYFELLTHLSMEPGYSLDYLYLYDWMGGYPVLMARPAEAAPYLNWEDAPQEASSYLEHVQTDGSPEGFLQYVLLDIMGNQFYLFWHANYNDTEVVCGQQEVRDILASVEQDDFGNPMPAADRLRALAIADLEPAVSIGDQTVEIRLVTFTKWGGFYRQTYTLRTDFPHTILDVRNEQLVEYDCGVLF